MYNVSIRLYAVLLVAASMAGFVSCGNSKSEEQLKAEALLSDAQSMFDSNQYDKSIALIDSLSKTYPGLIEVQRNAMHLKTLATEKKTILDSISNDSVIITNKQLVDSLSKGFKYVKTQDMVEGYYVKSSVSSGNLTKRTDVEARIDELGNKQKTVLIVTRLDEVQKRISLAIKIWKRIEEDADLKDWNFKIVGFGESEHEYRRLISQWSLKRIFLEGRQNPIRYYKESSLFMMTSLFEGWPMTLNESLQFGCVPFVYDTCASFHEIINNGENGFLITDKNEEEFYHKMREVMLDENRRMELMKASVESSTRFTLDKIVTRWEKVLSE